jgi:mannose/fructose/N-acetylgalactosamine-specific phosphotransferase system component IIC
MKLIKIITFLTLIASITSIICGFLLELYYSQKLIGFGVIGIFFIVFPLFSYYRWKGKSMKDYMLTKENLDKMRENQKINKY